MVSRKLAFVVATLVVALLAAGCGRSTNGGGASPEPTKSAERLSEPELKLRILDAMDGSIGDYCDPDAYPVAHGAPLENARMHEKEMEKDRDTYEAILAYEDIPKGQKLSDDELVEVYTVYKQLRFMELRPKDDGYAFSVHLSNGEATGTITAEGDVSPITTTSQDGGGCPICLARRTMISTPDGPVRIERLQIGDAVWTVDRQGRQVATTVAAVGRMPAPLGHEVVIVHLADGRAVTASPGHPLISGDHVGDLRVGTEMSGSVVVSVVRVPYSGFTYDILPAGPTGVYLANGIPLRSTLHESTRAA